MIITSYIKLPFIYIKTTIQNFFYDTAFSLSFSDGPTNYSSHITDL